MIEFSPKTRQIDKDFIFGLIKDALKDTKFLYCEEHGHTYSILSEKKEVIVKVEEDSDYYDLNSTYVLHKYKKLAFDHRFGFRITLDRSTKKFFLKVFRELQNRGRNIDYTYRSFRECYNRSLDDGIKSLLDDFETPVSKKAEKKISFDDLCRTIDKETEEIFLVE